jgi:ubiquinone biosynthesis protein
MICARKTLTALESGDDMSEPITFVSYARRTTRVMRLTAVAAVRMAFVAAVSTRGTRSDGVARELAQLLERLGGAFLKVGQLLGTRVDLVGEAVARALGRLHDNVEPMAAPQLAQALAQAGGDLVSRTGDLGLPVASGSIASVYRVDVDGRDVALKIRRPDIGRVIATDMAILKAMAAMASRLPGLRRAPLADIVDQVGECLVDQADFVAETVKLRELRAHLAACPDVLVPEVVPALCGDGVIAMEFVENLRHGSIETLPAEMRERGVVTLVRAVYRLLFVAGFVHADLHQGNTYFLPDGTVVVLDAGFSYRLSAAAQRSFTEFFGGMIRADGEACADILRATVRGVSPDADLARFREDVADLVTRNTGSAARDFNLPGFCFELFKLQRRHGLYAEPEFIFPMLSLLSLEGVVNSYHPTMEFQIEAAPYVMQGLLD